MEQSEQVNELFTALAKAQGQMEGAIKDSANPFFKSKYADLTSVWTACRKALTDNGLSVIQVPSTDAENVSITTQLCHSSGQWVSGKLSMKPVKTDPQSILSCITYIRRGSLASFVGVAPEDDDGNQASGKIKTQEFISEKEKSTIIDMINSKEVPQEKFLTFMGCKSIEEIPAIDFKKAMEALRSAKGKSHAANN